MKSIFRRMWKLFHAITSNSFFPEKMFIVVMLLLAVAVYHQLSLYFEQMSNVDSQPQLFFCCKIVHCEQCMNMCVVSSSEEERKE